jgi:3-hydroxyisobutyrate dehydrogenase-like beta-hydroxyacid dehydrogenase
MRVGFIGLGAMGYAMASNLLKAGLALNVYNRSPAKAEALAAKGAARAMTPAEAARGDVVITMLANDEAVESVVFGDEGVFGALRPSAIHISMSTISVALAERLAEAHRAKKQGFLSAPVFGRPEAAAAAKLYVVVAGLPEAAQRCLPLFEVLGQRSFVVGHEPPKANLVKLSGNFLITSVIEALGEAFALIGKAGIDRAQFLDVLTNTLFGAPIYKTYGELIAEERYHPAGFKAELGYKDVRLALAAAEALKVPMPVASLIATRLLALIAQGEGHLDWAALAKLAAQEAGLKPSPVRAGRNQK